MYIILVEDERNRSCRAFGPFRNETEATQHGKIAGLFSYRLVPYTSDVNLDTIDHKNVTIDKLEALIKVQQVMLKTLKVDKSLVDEINKDYRS